MSGSATAKDKEGEGSWKPGISGFSAGAVSTMLLLPLDNIKVRLQVNEGMNSKNSPKRKSSSAAATVMKDHYQRHPRLGAMQIVRGVIKFEGYRGLYQGLVPAMVGSAVSWGGFFYVYESMKRQLRYLKSDYNARYNTSSRHRNEHSKANKSQQEHTPLNSLDNFILATSSGVVMVFATNPIWLIKLRLQLQMKRASEHLRVKNDLIQYDGFVDAFRKIVRSEGVLGLYRGTGPALILTSHGGVQFVVYEFLRKHFHYARAQRSAESSLLKRFEDSLGYLTIGALSKMAASTITYPMQVVKSRIQQPSSSVELTNTGDVRIVRRDYVGLAGTIKKMWRLEGVRGFFKGAIPNAVRVAPSAAVTFLVYESMMDFFQDRYD